MSIVLNSVRQTSRAPFATKRPAPPQVAFGEALPVYEQLQANLTKELTTLPVGESIIIGREHGGFIVRVTFPEVPGFKKISAPHLRITRTGPTSYNLTDLISKYGTTVKLGGRVTTVDSDFPTEAQAGSEVVLADGAFSFTLP